VCVCVCVLRKVENHDHCVYDYVEVRDGHEDSSRLLGKYCGHRMPHDVKSTTNKMYVKFVSDASVQKGGFAAVFVKGRCFISTWTPASLSLSLSLSLCVYGNHAGK